MPLALERPDAQAAWEQGEDPLTNVATDLELREAMAAGLRTPLCRFNVLR